LGAFLKPQGLPYGYEGGRKRRKIKRRKRRQEQRKKLVRHPTRKSRMGLPPQMMGFKWPDRVGFSPKLGYTYKSGT